MGRESMILKNYRKEIFRSRCDSGAMSLHCYAHLDQDVGDVLTFLNSVLGGTTYIKEPPSVTFQAYGKLITVHARTIAVNALKDEAQAERILERLERVLNQAWENRDQITPSFESRNRPQLIEILKQLPRSNCRECGFSTCMVFTAQVADGGKGAEGCPALGADSRRSWQIIFPDTGLMSRHIEAGFRKEMRI
jgi:ArsR family metal-binding transcriptional regulator